MNFRKAILYRTENLSLIYRSSLPIFLSLILSQVFLFFEMVVFSLLGNDFALVAFGVSFLMLLLNAPSAAISVYLRVRLSKLKATENIEEFRRVYSSGVSLIFIISVVLVTIFYLFSSSIITWYFPSRQANMLITETYLQIKLISSVIISISCMLTALMYSLNQMSLVLGRTFGLGLLTSLCLTSIWLMNGSLIDYAITSTIATILYEFLFFIYLRSWFGNISAPLIISILKKSFPLIISQVNTIFVFVVLTSLYKGSEITSLTMLIIFRFIRVNSICEKTFSIHSSVILSQQKNIESLKKKLSDIVLAGIIFYLFVGLVEIILKDEIIFILTKDNSISKILEFSYLSLIIIGFFELIQGTLFSYLTVLDRYKSVTLLQVIFSWVILIPLTFVTGIYFEGNVEEYLAIYFGAELLLMISMILLSINVTKNNKG